MLEGLSLLLPFFLRYRFKVGGVVPAASQFFFVGTDVGGLVPAASQVFFRRTDLRLEGLSLLLPHSFLEMQILEGCPCCFPHFLEVQMFGGVVPAASHFFEVRI